MGTAQSNENAANFFNNLGSAITHDIASPGNIALGVSNLLNGIGNNKLVIPLFNVLLKALAIFPGAAISLVIAFPRLEKNLAAPSLL